LDVWDEPGGSGRTAADAERAEDEGERNEQQGQDGNRG
jgi:hypothetical protein